jgi:hypothetical protein
MPSGVLSGPFAESCGLRLDRGGRRGYLFAQQGASERLGRAMVSVQAPAGRAIAGGRGALRAGQEGVDVGGELGVVLKRKPCAESG